MAQTPLVSVGLVTWNSADQVERCLCCLRAQTHSPIELLVVDNDSHDGTRGIVERLTAPHERLWLERNHGYSGAHNLAIARTHGEFYLALNPDVFAEATFIDRLVAGLSGDERAGAASGKLMRTEPPGVIDSTGIYMLPSQRHLDRGADEMDTGQYDRAEYVFGASGAAALYRRAMLNDVRVEDEVFDEAFFAYREDADLAWRAQILGWRCRYVPDAVARHGRLVTPERRRQLPPDLNRYSVRNRFLLRIKNQTASEALRFLLPSLARDLQVIGYVALREWSSLPAFLDVVRLLPGTIRKRRAIMRRRRASSREMQRWFGRRSEPLPPNSPCRGVHGV